MSRLYSRKERDFSELKSAEQGGAPSFDRGLEMYFVKGNSP